MMLCYRMIFFGVQFDKWRFNDKRWNHIPYDKNNPWNSFSDENIQLEFENDFLLMGENVGLSTYRNLSYRCFNS